MAIEVGSKAGILALLDPGGTPSYGGPLGGLKQLISVLSGSLRPGQSESDGTGIKREGFPLNRAECRRAMRVRLLSCG